VGPRPRGQRDTGPKDIRSRGRALALSRTQPAAAAAAEAKAEGAAAAEVQAARRAAAHQCRPSARRLARAVARRRRRASQRRMHGGPLCERRVRAALMDGPPDKSGGRASSGAGLPPWVRGGLSRWRGLQAAARAVWDLDKQRAGGVALCCENGCHRQAPARASFDERRHGTGARKAGTVQGRCTTCVGARHFLVLFLGACGRNTPALQSI
jgi:hypothetical protein